MSKTLKPEERYPLGQYPGGPFPRPAWWKVMEVVDPQAFLCGVRPEKRPRRWSQHALAGVLGLTTPEQAEAMLAEMEASGEVIGYYCTDVGTTIFYLRYLRERMIDGGPHYGDAAWEKARALLKEYPFPATQGFRRFPRAGQSRGMASPFDPLDPGDKEHERLVRAALEEKAA